MPISALIADTTIAEAVVDATVEANMRPPVALIPGKSIAAPAPITGSPEVANFGSHHPRARNPKIAFIAIRPVAGRPQITGSGNHGLLVHRQRGRRDHDGHAELRQRSGRYGDY